MGGCGNPCGRSNNRRGSDGCGRDGQRSGRRRAAERAVSECGSLNDCGCDCDCASEREQRAEAREDRAERRAERAEAREERAERRAERAERRAENNNCDVSDMIPPRWQDFPGVSHSNRDDCGCDN